MARPNKLVVVKVGTTSLTGPAGRLDHPKIAAVTDCVAQMRNNGQDVVLVTSGAIAAGFERLGYAERPRTVPAKQASAAVGQGLLIGEYASRLAEKNITVAQLLLTRADFSDRRRYQNAYNTLSVLLKKDAVPVINENDTVSIEELRFGDNDRLSAEVAALVHADLLVILTDVGGLYDANPAEHPGAKIISRVPVIDSAIEAMAQGSGSRVGTGGMASKIAAAKLATSAGVPVVICGPSTDSVIAAAHGQPAGTFFNAAPRALGTRLQWVAFHSDTRGQITVDDGAAEALSARHTSLLPSGVTDASGGFSAGDVVEVVDARGEYIGRGIARYSCAQLMQVKGLRSRRITELLGEGYAEAIHRDDWLGAARMTEGR